MKTRTSLVLAIVAAGLLAFIMLYERRQATTDELEARSDRVLPDFSRDSVDRLVLGQGDDRIELVRQSTQGGDAGPTGSVGRWQLLHPLGVAADEEAVDNLLNAIDWLERRRTIEEDGAANDAQYGLNEPRARANMRLRGREVTLLLGADAPGESIYAAIEGDDDRVFAVDREILDELTRDAGDLRDKRLAQIRLPQVQAIRVTGRFHVERAGAMRWHLTAPVAMRADVSAVEDLVRELESLRARRYIADDVGEGELERFGLDTAEHEISIRLEGEDAPVVLRVGGECEGHADERYATSLGSGTVACVPADLLEELTVEPAALRDMRATRLRASAVDGITVIRGDRELVIERAGGRWRISGDDDLTADDDAVEGFLEALRDAVAEDLEEDLEPSRLAGAEPQPDAEVRFRLSEEEGEGAEILRFALSAERVLLRRGDEGVALVLPGSLSETLTADPVGFRARQVIDEEASQAVSIEVTAGSEQQRLTLSDSLWQVTSPIEHRADDTVVRGLVRAFAALTADRFVAATPSAPHGLSSPRFSLKVRFEGTRDGEADGGPADGGASFSREHTLLIGAETEGGSFATLEGSDDAVFVVDDELVRSISAPLLDRDLLAFDEDAVRSVTVERGPERFELSRADDGWQLGSEETDSGPVERLLSQLAVTRAAEVTAYGPPSPATGLGQPRATVTVRIEDEDEGTPAELVMVIGVEYGEEEERLVHVRRTDVGATFGIPARRVEPILELGIVPTE